MEYYFNTYAKHSSSPEEIMDHYSSIVPFLGIALGEIHEVALLDCRSRQLVAIANGHISGRRVGDPMTNLASTIADKGDWKHSDYITNYPGIISNGTILRSSTYFIKHNGELIGMLCINVDTSAYSQISELALRIGGIIPEHDHTAEFASEVFIDSVSNSVNQTLKELFGDNIPAHFSMDERIKILRILNDKKVFLIKGAVPRVAEILGCSEPTIYRGIKMCETM